MLHNSSYYVNKKSKKECCVHACVHVCEYTYAHVCTCVCVHVCVCVVCESFVSIHMCLWVGAGDQSTIVHHIWVP